MIIALIGCKRVRLREERRCRFAGRALPHVAAVLRLSGYANAIP